jgi:hypothetical protein
MFLFTETVLCKILTAYVEKPWSVVTYVCGTGRRAGGEDCCTDGRHPPAECPSPPAPRSATWKSQAVNSMRKEILGQKQEAGLFNP